MAAARAASVLLSLVANATWEWWWADPIAALGIAAIALREGHEHWEQASAMSPGASQPGQPARRV
ncbi:MAG: hypothetical protein OEP52_11920 [Acidimicrobiia bacterium]|nr:hypothetical protein [Acidimicrobiia bacterium]